MIRSKAALKSRLFILAAAVLMWCCSPTAVLTASADTYNAEYDITSGSVTITSDGRYRVYGNSTETSNTITVTVSDSSAEVLLVLDNVNISSSESCPLYLNNSGTTLVKLSGTNVLTNTYTDTAGINAYPGIYKNTTGYLVITSLSGDDSADTLTATGGTSAAGIGGKFYGGNVSNIKISGGTVIAKGSDYAAGIGGGGYNGTGDNIKISGGIVTATGGYGGAGIGGGYAGLSEGVGSKNIQISGGTVTATGGTGASGIGGGYNGSTSGVVIYNASVKASSIGMTPKNAAGNSLSLYTIPNTVEGEKLCVDGETVIESVVHHTSSDTNQYLYLPIMPSCVSSDSWIYEVTNSSGSISYNKIDAENISDMEIPDTLSFRLFGSLVRLGYTAINGTLTGDIVLNEGDFDSSTWTAWTPMGNDDAPYAGTFDGGGHTVSGVYCDGSTDHAGLFGVCFFATINDVGVVNSYISGKTYVGGIIGVIAECTEIENCYNTGTIASTGDNYSVGGICGLNSGSIILNCYNTGTVSVVSTGTNGVSAGGICGYSYGGIENSYNTGSISAESDSSYVRVGGICGDSYGEIENCYNTGSISAKSNPYAAYAGGICGNSEWTAKMNRCYNTGSASAESDSDAAYAGGISGMNGYEGAIANCCNTSFDEDNYCEISAESNSGDAYAGGISGYNASESTISYCYSCDTTVPTITTLGSQYSAAVVGYNDSNGSVNYCYDTTGSGVGNDSTIDTYKSAEAFSSGEVAYLLNDAQSENVWHQTIGIDSLPLFSGETVCYDDINGYYNAWFTVNGETAALAAAPSGIELVLGDTDNLSDYIGDPMITAVMKNSGDTAAITSYTVTIEGGSFTEPQVFTPTRTGLFGSDKYYMAQIIGAGIEAGDYTVTVTISYTVGDSQLTYTASSDVAISAAE